jgi:hypothetical protein
MPSALSNIGLVPPQDFPVEHYEAVLGSVQAAFNGTPAYEHFSAAWSAVAYRFKSFGRAGAAFSLSLETDGVAPAPERRYEQEESLYAFFSAGFSVFESACYGLFAIGSNLRPVDFPLSSPKEQQQVSPARTRDAVVKAFPTDPLVTAFATLFGESAYQSLREVRNVLTHRTAPGRHLFASLGTDDAPVATWKLNDIPLDAALIPERKKDVARMLDALLAAVSTFTKQRLPPVGPR